jgi:hypothetical protein
MPPPSNRFGRNSWTPLVMAPSAPRSAHPVDEPRSSARSTGRRSSTGGALTGWSEAALGGAQAEVMMKAHGSWAFGFGRNRSYATGRGRSRRKWTAWGGCHHCHHCHQSPPSFQTFSRVNENPARGRPVQHALHVWLLAEVVTVVTVGTSLISLRFFCHHLAHLSPPVVTGRAAPAFRPRSPKQFAEPGG